MKVGTIEEAKKFYVEILGFDITAELGRALFVSVAGYHHHLGMNTWESLGAGKRFPSLGLNSFELILNSKKDISALKERLNGAKLSYNEKEGTLFVNDPWNNRIIVKSH